jgi:tetratricopeptide (TPR) repeat protein
VLEASARVQLSGGQTWVTMRVPNSGASQEGGGSAPTVSVQQLRVPDKAASFLAKAHQAMDKSKLDDAANYVSKALMAYPEYAQALALRGVLELQREQFAQAAADAEHAIQADPAYGTGYLVMGAALNCQKKFQEALRPLQQAEALLPNAWQGYFESSKALLQLGKFQEALQQVSKALTLGEPSRHPELHVLKGFACLGLHTYGAALTEFQQYLSQEPNGPYTAQVRSTLEKIRPLAAAAVAP